MEALAKNLKRQIRTETNVRFLRRMPMFAVDHSLPREMRDLLGQIDEAERRDSETRQ